MRIWNDAPTGKLEICSHSEKAHGAETTDGNPGALEVPIQGRMTHQAPRGCSFGKEVLV
jgi:hypothetical protein